MSFNPVTPVRPSPFVLGNKPSTSFSTISSAASATSVGTSRSGGSRLLFGEIDTSSDRSSEAFASVCSLVLSDSSTFLRFWLTETCRESLISHLDKPTLAKLRLVCHDFSTRAAPALFENMSVTFKSSTFTRPSRLAALDRIGYHVKSLSFKIPHTPETFLPPLVHPDTGEELSFSYTPQVLPPSSRRPKFGDEGTTEVLTRQYPPLFHAATNVAAFMHGFSAFVNLTHLRISCPGYDTTQRFRRSVVDYALISLRIAVERNCLYALEHLTLAPIHPGGLLYLSPLLGYGATPSSGRRWSRIKHLTIHTTATANLRDTTGQPDQCRLLHTYLSGFQSNLETFDFRWLGDQGPLPIDSRRCPPHPVAMKHPADAGLDSSLTPDHHPPTAKPIHFARIKDIRLTNISTTASAFNTFLLAHEATLSELEYDAVTLTQGTWDEAFAPARPAPLRPSTPRTPTRPSHEVADIPIMLSPDSTGSPPPWRMERVETVQRVDSVHSRRRFPGRRKPPSAAKRVGERCEELWDKVLKGSVHLWR